jgi:hypothetical protein
MNRSAGGGKKNHKKKRALPQPFPGYTLSKAIERLVRETIYNQKHKNRTL